MQKILKIYLFPLLLLFVFYLPIASSQDSNENAIQEPQVDAVSDGGEDVKDPNIVLEKDGSSDEKAIQEPQVDAGSDGGEDVKDPNIVLEKDGSNIRLIGYIAFLLLLFLFTVTTLLFRHVKWEEDILKMIQLFFLTLT